MSNIDETFADLASRIRAIGRDVIAAVSVDIVKTVKAGYNKLDVVRNEEGKVMSRIHPSRVADAVRMSLSDDVALIYIDGDEENLEARRQYANGLGPDNDRNPFLAAIYRLRSKPTISDITGTEAK